MLNYVQGKVATAIRVLYVIFLHRCRPYLTDIVHVLAHCTDTLSVLFRNAICCRPS